MTTAPWALGPHIPRPWTLVPGPAPVEAGPAPVKAGPAPVEAGPADPLAAPLADPAPGDPAPEVARLEGLADRPLEHVPLLDGGQPEGELVGEVVTGASGSVTLWGGEELNFIVS